VGSTRRRAAPLPDVRRVSALLPAIPECRRDRSCPSTTSGSRCRPDPARTERLWSVRGGARTALPMCPDRRPGQALEAGGVRDGFVHTYRDETATGRCGVSAPQWGEPGTSRLASCPGRKPAAATSGRSGARSPSAWSGKPSTCRRLAGIAIPITTDVLMAVKRCLPTRGWRWPVSWSQWPRWCSRWW
jgi:hypothetical protein